MSLRRFYVLDDDQNVVEASARAWAEFLEDTEKRAVAWTEIAPGIVVGTDFIGWEPNPSGEEPQFVFRTMVRTNDVWGDWRMYPTWEEAERGHEQVVEVERRKLKEAEEEERYYILDAARNVVEVTDEAVWDRFMDNPDNTTVARTEIAAGIVVTTFFSGLELSGMGSPPHVFATMVQNDYGDTGHEGQRCYPTWKAAARDHEKFVAEQRAKLGTRSEDA